MPVLRSLTRLIGAYQNVNKINQCLFKKVSTRYYCDQYEEKASLKEDEKIVPLSNQFENVERTGINYSNIDPNSLTLTAIEENVIIKMPSKQNEISVLEPCDEDNSRYKPFLPVTQTLAGYANHSKTIQNLIDLGVQLHRWEDNDIIMNLLINLDTQVLQKYILFLHEIVGVNMDDMGALISKCPHILKESLVNLNTRVDYLKYKRFSDDEVASIITRHPKWIMYKLEYLDERLGLFQQIFGLTGNEVRSLSVRLPKVITQSKKQLQTVNFSVREEMGFDHKEIKQILINHPRFWTQDPRNSVELFEYVHKTMSISHSHLCSQPKILTTRIFRLKHRHEFLKSLGRDQYDPEKENYISLDMLISGNDADFCALVAKVPIHTFNLFLKSF